jgi:hypothetical protein
VRIFLLCQQSNRSHAVPAYAFWRRYFTEGIREAGHEWIEPAGVDWAEGLLPRDTDEHARWREHAWSQTIAQVKAEHARQPVHLVLSYLFPAQIEPHALAELRALGIPCVNFFCDNVREFTRVPREFLGFDSHWVPEYAAVAMYRRAGLSFVHAPMPVWTPPSTRQIPEHEIDQATFIGSHDVLRERLLGDAVAHGLRLHIYGAGWDAPAKDVAASAPAPGALVKRGSFLERQRAFLRSQGLCGYAMKLTYKLQRPRPRAWLDERLQPPIYDDTYFRLTRESAVAVGINRYPDFRHAFWIPGSYSRLRDIEAPMLGACYLTEDCPGLDQLYEPGVEIETYRTAGELAEKSRALLADPTRRRELRTRAQRRALSEHTIARSLDKIFAALNLPKTS